MGLRMLFKGGYLFMRNIYEDIVIYNNSVGKLIQDFDINLKIPIFRFYPAGYGPYYPEHLEIEIGRAHV